MSVIDTFSYFVLYSGMVWLSVSSISTGISHLLSIMHIVYILNLTHTFFTLSCLPKPNCAGSYSRCPFFSTIQRRRLCNQASSLQLGWARLGSVGLVWYPLSSFTNTVWLNLAVLAVSVLLGQRCILVEGSDPLWFTVCCSSLLCSVSERNIPVINTNVTRTGCIRVENTVLTRKWKGSLSTGVPIYRTVVIGQNAWGRVWVTLPLSVRDIAFVFVAYLVTWKLEFSKEWMSGWYVWDESGGFHIKYNWCRFPNWRWIWKHSYFTRSMYNNILLSSLSVDCLRALYFCTGSVLSLRSRVRVFPHHFALKQLHLLLCAVWVCFAKRAERDCGLSESQPIMVSLPANHGGISFFSSPCVFVIGGDPQGFLLCSPLHHHPHQQGAPEPRFVSLKGTTHSRSQCASHR